MLRKRALGSNVSNERLNPTRKGKQVNLQHATDAPFSLFCIKYLTAGSQNHLPGLAAKSLKSRRSRLPPHHAGRLFAIPRKESLDAPTPFGHNSSSPTRGGAVWQLVGLITRRSQVQILSPQPNTFSRTPDLSGSGVLFLCVVKPQPSPPSRGNGVPQQAGGKLAESGRCPALRLERAQIA